MLRLNRDLTKKQRIARVEELLEFVSLYKENKLYLFEIFSFKVEFKKSRKNTYWSTWTYQRFIRW
jgi:hypothetical protein